MIERGLQLGAAMLGCLAEALAMNGWPDAQNDEVQGHRIVREGHAQIWKCAVGEIEMRIWTVGLDAVGRPRYLRAKAERGGDCSPESAGVREFVSYTWDVGSQDKIRYAWRH